MNTVLTSPKRTKRSVFSQSGVTAQLLQKGFRMNHRMQTLEQLFNGQEVIEMNGPVGTGVRALCTDSRRVTPGALFFALPGKRTKGHLYIEEAIDRGAIGIVTEVKEWVPRKTAMVVVEDVRAVLAETARRFHRNPEKSLSLIGVTGTSGKTVVSTLVRHLLSEAEPVGLLGTIHYALGVRTLPAYRTTPEPVDLYAMLSQMKDGGCRKAVMEVSSHGIDQGRVSELPFETLAFLNLTTQHLEYHGTMDHYFDTILQAFDGRNHPQPKKAVINLDDSYGKRLLEAVEGTMGVTTFGIEAEGVDVSAKDIEYRVNDTRFTVCAEGQEWRVVSPLIGEFNVSNVLAAMVIAREEKQSWETIIRRLFEFEGVRGRMERVDCGQRFNVIIDYMNTAESYEKGLDMLRGITEGRLITVFGCGGDRDPMQRPRITRSVIEHSDLVFATADNPRSETVEDIFEDMREGLKAESVIHFIENRRHAINLALDAAEAGDTVVIAGKGHETYQEYADSVLPFDDRSVARDLLKKKVGYLDA